MSDRNFDIREYFDFSSRRFIIIIAAVILIVVLLVVLMISSKNKASTESADAGTEVSTTLEAEDGRTILNADKEMIDQYNQSIVNAKNLYQGKSIRFRAYPEYVDAESGEGVLFLIDNGSDKVRFSCVATDSTIKKSIKTLDDQSEVTVSGKVQDVTEEEGYVILLKSVEGQKKTTLPTGSATVTMSPGTIVTTVLDKSKSSTENTTNANTVMSVKKVKNKYILYADNVKQSGYTGLVHVSINGENGYYYFKNGVWQASWNGIRKMNGKRYMVTDGKLQMNYSGKFILDGTEYRVVNGVIQ